jgi:hypothetical protein
MQRSRLRLTAVALTFGFAGAVHAVPFHAGGRAALGLLARRG